MSGTIPMTGRQVIDLMNRVLKQETISRQQVEAIVGMATDVITNCANIIYDLRKQVEEYENYHNEINSIGNL